MMMNGHEHWHGTNCCAMAIAMVMAVCSLERAAGMHGCEAQQHVKRLCHINKQ